MNNILPYIVFFALSASSIYCLYIIGDALFTIPEISEQLDEIIKLLKEKK